MTTEDRALIMLRRQYQQYLSDATWACHYDRQKRRRPADMEWLHALATRRECARLAWIISGSRQPIHLPIQGA